MAPLVVKDKVLVGNSGGEFGVRGWLTALDGADRQAGLERLQHRPRQGLLIGPSFKPFYRAGPRARISASRRGRPTPGRSAAARVGLDLLRPRARTSSTTAPRNPGPWNPDSGPATTSGPAASSRATPTPARRVWFYQWSPHDLYDHDGINENVLLDLPIERRRRARCSSIPIATATSTSSTARRARCSRPTPFAPSTRSTGVDLKTGQLIRSTDKKPQLGKVVRDICPAAPGAKDWQPSVLLAADRAALHPAREPLHGLRGRRSQLHRRHAVRRRQREMYAGPGRQPRRVHGVGSRRRQERSGRSRRTFRSGAARSRPRATSSSTERWKAGSRRSTRARGSVLWQFKTRLGDHRPADHLPRVRTASSTWRSSRRRRLGRRGRGQ